MDKINVLEKFNKVTGYWNPGIAASLNGQEVKLARFLGSFPWHHHENEDELFYVVKGSFTMEFRDRKVALLEGEILVVPRGVEHRPVADKEAWVMLFEPASTINTGEDENAFTKKNLTNI